MNFKGKKREGRKRKEGEGRKWKEGRGKEGGEGIRRQEGEGRKREGRGRKEKEGKGRNLKEGTPRSDPAPGKQPLRKNLQEQLCAQAGTKRGPGLGSFSRADRGIGPVRHVAPPTWLVSNLLVRPASS